MLFFQRIINRAAPPKGCFWEKVNELYTKIEESEQKKELYEELKKRDDRAFAVEQ